MSTIVNATAQRSWASLMVASPLRLVAACWPQPRLAEPNPGVGDRPVGAVQEDHPATAANTKISVDRSI